MTAPTQHPYRQRLEAWIPAARPWLYRVPSDPECVCYGIGNHGHWALQASNTAFGAFAVLAADPDTDCGRTGMSRDELMATALSMFRFCVRSHHAGTGASTDGLPWGHSWISALCQERFFHGVEAIQHEFTARDRHELRAMLLSEADWLLDEYEIVAGLVRDNKPESNVWNGALLYRAAALYPDAPHVEEYRDKGATFLVNGISVPGDAECGDSVADRTVSQRHVGANFYESYACNHHGYMNVGYMVITLSNIAMLHFAGRTVGVTWPDVLYRHVEPLWQLVKTCTFPDGRLMRIGGDSRVRYCYCQDYAIPVWLMMRDRFGDTDTAEFETRWLEQVGVEQMATEQGASGDGSFMGRRLAAMRDTSPLYYTRLEGDKAVTLSMGAYWHRVLPELSQPVASPAPAPLLPHWEDEYHGACLVRGARRTASWIWRAAELPQGLCLPPDASDLAEWKTNLAGRIVGMGMVHEHRLERHCEAAFDGGFATCGRVTIGSSRYYAEGAFDEDVAVEDLAFAALPDDTTVVGLQRARATNRVYLREAKGLMLQVPNDVFNGFTRTYASADGEGQRRGRDGQRLETEVRGGWLNVDGRLGVVALSGAPLTLLHPDRPGIPIKAYPWQAHTHIAGGFLFVDEICMGCSDRATSWDAGQTLFDVSFAVQAGVTAAQTAAWAAANAGAAITSEAATDDLGTDDLGTGDLGTGELGPRELGDVRALQVVGADGRTYVVAANFGDHEARLAASGRSLGGFVGEGGGLVLPPGACGVALAG